MAKVRINKTVWINAKTTTVRGEPGEGKQQLGDVVFGTPVHAVLLVTGVEHPITHELEDWYEIDPPTMGFLPKDGVFQKPNKAPFIKAKFTIDHDPTTGTPPPAMSGDALTIDDLAAGFEAALAAIRARHAK